MLFATFTRSAKFAGRRSACHSAESLFGVYSYVHEHYSLGSPGKAKLNLNHICTTRYIIIKLLLGLIFSLELGHRDGFRLTIIYLNHKENSKSI